MNIPDVPQSSRTDREIIDELLLYSIEKARQD